MIVVHVILYAALGLVALLAAGLFISGLFERVTGAAFPVPGWPKLAVRPEYPLAPPPRLFRDRHQLSGWVAMQVGGAVFMVCVIGALLVARWS